MMTKQIFAVMLAIAFTLGVAGPGFSAQGRGEAPVKRPADTKVCCDINCCGDQADAKKDAVETKKTEEGNWKSPYEGLSW